MKKNRLSRALRRQHKDKRTYKTKEEADAVAALFPNLHSYQCQVCHQWHVGHLPRAGAYE